jgi:hypothetical protein
MQLADAAYLPSPSLLACDDPLPLLSQFDGPSLTKFNAITSSVYQAKSIPIALRARVDVPIHIVARGSIVEYHISTDMYDMYFSVTAEHK